MSEKSISERGKDTLKWIQKEQKANDLGMVKSAQVPDQDALRFLLLEPPSPQGCKPS